MNTVKNQIQQYNQIKSKLQLVLNLLKIDTVSMVNKNFKKTKNQQKLPNQLIQFKIKNSKILKYNNINNNIKNNHIGNFDMFIIDETVKSNPNKVKIIKLFCNFMKNFKTFENYNNYLENIDYGEDVIDDFLTKHNMKQLKKSKQMMNQFNIIVAKYDEKYLEQENEYLESRESIYKRMNKRKHKNKKLTELEKWWKNRTVYKIIDSSSKAIFEVGFDVDNYNEDNNNSNQSADIEPIGYLYNKNKQLVGYVVEWIDEKNEVPEKFKMCKNRVQHPNNGQPIYQFIFYESGRVYHNLPRGKHYMEFKYDPKDCNLKPTNEIKKL